MGFLSNMLPTVIGVGVGAATGNPWLGAAAAGGLKYSQTGNLMQSGLAALGGYGGANLGEALAKQGMETAARETAAQSLGATAKDVALNPDKFFIAQQAQPLAPVVPFAEIGETMNVPVANQANIDAYTGAFNQAMAGPSTGTAGLTNLGRGVASLGEEGGLSNLYNQMGGGTTGALKLAAAAAPMLEQKPKEMPTIQPETAGQRYTYAANATSPTPAPDVPGYDNLSQDFGKEQRYYQPSYTKISEAEAKKIYGYAPGGVIPSVGGANINYPQSNITQGQYANAWQTPVSRNMFSGGSDTDTNTNQMTGEMLLASGGISDLGGYSDGGRLLRGPGDGVSDSIPATIANKRPARLADGEFVVPARIVSELGNGSTDAGARELYKMMDRVQSARAKTTGKGKVAKKNSPQQMMPA